MCPTHGPQRRTCRLSCAQGTSCTSEGTRIGTLAYVVTECVRNPQGRSTSRQKLLIRLGNCDPISAMEVDTSQEPDPLELCNIFGRSRSGFGSQVGGTFQHLAVLPSGSKVVFELNKSLAPIPAFTPDPPVEGIFIVNADGSGLRRLGPASRYPTMIPFPDPLSPIGFNIEVTGTAWSVSPDGRSITLIDLGSDGAGREAPQRGRMRR